MKICQNCFCDTEIKSIIASRKTSGVCDVCGSDSYVYDTTTSGDLVDILDDFLNMYKKVQPSVPQELRRNLEKELIYGWHILSPNCEHQVKNIVDSIYSFSNDTRERFDCNLFDDDVYIPQIMDYDCLTKYSILQQFTWDDFTRKIKYDNRYHSEILNTQAFDAFISPLVKIYPANTCFYRARISGNKLLAPKEMRIPPIEKRRAGRIGAEGIPCFYLTNDIDTAIKEVRAGAFDYVTVAKFKLKNEIKVVDLRLLDNISPFSVSDPVSLAINKDTLLMLKSEVEKPIRATENTIEYIPIQYFCDYIRSKDFMGIVYNSTMSTQGYNLSAFSDSYFNLVNRKLYYINNLSVGFTQTTNRCNRTS